METSYRARTLADECFPLHIGFSSHAFELLLESYVSVETRRVFVEVQEGLRLSVEMLGLFSTSPGTERSLSSSGSISERLLGGVSHVKSLYFGPILAAPVRLVGDSAGRPVNLTMRFGDVRRRPRDPPVADRPGTGPGG